MPKAAFNSGMLVIAYLELFLCLNRSWPGRLKVCGSQVTTFLVKAFTLNMLT